MNIDKPVQIVEEKELISPVELGSAMKTESYIEKEVKKEVKNNNKRYIGEVAELPATVGYEEGTLVRKGKTVFIKQDGIWESLIEGNTVTREVVKYGVPGGGCGVDEVKRIIKQEGTPTFGSYAELVASGYTAQGPGSKAMYLENGVLFTATLTAESGWTPEHRASILIDGANLLFGPNIPSAANAGVLSALTGGKERAVIACVGESTTRGIGSSLPLGASSGTIDYSWPSFLGAKLRAMGFEVSHMETFPSISDPDNRYTLGTGWSASPLGCALKSCVEFSAGAPGDLVIRAPDGFRWDRAVIYYQKTPAGTGTASVTATGGEPATLTTYDASRSISTVECSAGKISSDNTVTIHANNNGKVWCYAVEFYRSTHKTRITLANLGVGGSDSGGWAGASGSLHGYDLVAALNADLTLVCIGGNDSTGGTNASSFLANLTTFCAAVSPTTTLCLLPITPRVTEQAKLLVDRYVAGYSAILGVTSLGDLWPYWRGLSLPGVAGSAMHLAGPAYKVIADAIASRIFA